MKAAIYRKTGSAAEVFEIVDIEEPSPGRGDVLVKIYSSGINPTDTKTRAGIFPSPPEWNYILPHHDGAGIIESVGPGVPKSRIGERVWLHSTQWSNLAGTAAEFAVSTSGNAIPLPENISFDHGATFGVPLLTAYHAVTMDGDVAGKTLLVQGGAGAVGNYAVQIAKAKGAKVIATVSSDAKKEAAHLAGADEVINYRSEDLVKRVQQLTSGVGVDHLIEVNLGANAELLPAAMKNGGFVAVYGSEAPLANFPAIGSIIQQLRIGFFIVFALPQERLASAAEDLTEMLSLGKIKGQVFAELPLEQIAEAHDLVDAKDTVGNVILKIVP